MQEWINEVLAVDDKHRKRRWDIRLGSKQEGGPDVSRSLRCCCSRPWHTLSSWVRKKWISGRWHDFIIQRDLGNLPCPLSLVIQESSCQKLRVKKERLGLLRAAREWPTTESASIRLLVREPSEGLTACKGCCEDRTWARDLGDGQD